VCPNGLQQWSELRPEIPKESGQAPGLAMPNIGNRGRLAPQIQYRGHRRHFQKSVPACWQMLSLDVKVQRLGGQTHLSRLNHTPDLSFWQPVTVVEATLPLDHWKRAWSTTLSFTTMNVRTKVCHTRFLQRFTLQAYQPVFNISIPLV